MDIKTEGAVIASEAKVCLEKRHLFGPRRIRHFSLQLTVYWLPTPATWLKVDKKMATRLVVLIFENDTFDRFLNRATKI